MNRALHILAWTCMLLLATHHAWAKGGAQFPMVPAAKGPPEALLQIFPESDESILRKNGPKAAAQPDSPRSAGPAHHSSSELSPPSRTSTPPIFKRKPNREGRVVEGKRQALALVLSIFLGVLGIHRFYLGYIGIGLIQMLTLGGLGIWFIVDAFRIGSGKLKPVGGPYAYRMGKVKTEETEAGGGE